MRQIDLTERCDSSPIGAFGGCIAAYQGLWHVELGGTSSPGEDVLLLYISIGILKRWPFFRVIRRSNPDQSGVASINIWKPTKLQVADRTVKTEIPKNKSFLVPYFNFRMPGYILSNDSETIIHMQ